MTCFSVKNTLPLWHLPRQRGFSLIKDKICRFLYAELDQLKVVESWVEISRVAYIITLLINIESGCSVSFFFPFDVLKNDSSKQPCAVLPCTDWINCGSGSGAYPQRGKNGKTMGSKFGASAAGKLMLQIKCTTRSTAMAPDSAIPSTWNYLLVSQLPCY